MQFEYSKAPDLTPEGSIGGGVARSMSTAMTVGPFLPSPVLQRP